MSEISSLNAINSSNENSLNADDSVSNRSSDEENLYDDEVADEGEEELAQLDTNIAAKQSSHVMQRLQMSDFGIVQSRMDKTLDQLKKYKELEEPEFTKKELRSSLNDDVCARFGYNADLVKLFFKLFKVEEAIKFIEANELVRPITIRTNTLKTKRSALAKVLIQKGVTLENAASWSKVGLQVRKT